MPTFNRATYIDKTIKSLLQNKYSTFEIIVVDDGSTDETESVVKDITDDRLSYYKKNNAERGAARNFGAKLAKGQYINFFDSDDVCYPNHLEEANKAASKLRTPEMFHLGYDVKDADGKLLRQVENLPNPINDRLIDGNHLSCNGVFIRKDICDQFPFSENRKLSASEDYELWLRLASRFPFYNVEVITSTVVDHESRSVMKINLDSFVERINLLQENLLKDDMFMRCYSNRLNLFQAYLNIYMALHLSLAQYPKRVSIRYLMRVFLLTPQISFTRRFLAALKNIIL